MTRPIEGSLKELLDNVRRAVHARRSPATVGLVRLVPPSTRGPDRNLPAPYVVAVDVPSGVDPDTGQVDLATVSADLTVTFAAAKRGQFQFPAAPTLGELVIADIGIDPDLATSIQLELATAQAVSRLLPPRPPDAHKGTFGRVMIVAGSVNYTGAPFLCAAGAARVGAGLVTIAPPQPIHPILASKLAEATYLLLPHSMGVLAPPALKVLASHLEGYSALLLGPGLGQEDETVDFVHQLLGITSTGHKRGIGFQPKVAVSAETATLPPLVIDADGLNALAKAEGWWEGVPASSILTPHPGEMSRLTGMDARAINRDRVGVARDHANQWRQVIVLKGAYTVVAAPDGRATLIPFANPGLATAGTGDVLAGAIVGLLAQGLPPYEAAVCGAYLHGLAGQIAASCVGAAGMLAGDLLPALPEAIRRLYQMEEQ